MGEESWPSASRCLPIHPPLLTNLAWQRERFSLHCEGTQGRGRQDSRTHSSQRPGREPCAAQDPPEGSMWAAEWTCPLCHVRPRLPPTSCPSSPSVHCAARALMEHQPPCSLQQPWLLLRPGTQREEEATLVQAQESPCWVTRTASTWEAMRLALWGEAGGGALPRQLQALPTVSR